MAELRYRWGHGPVQPRPTPAENTHLTLWVGDRMVFEGDVTEELRAWGRWCALRVALLWRCPLEVFRYLRSGDASGQSAAQDALDAAMAPLPHWVPKPLPMVAAAAAIRSPPESGIPAHVARRALILAARRAAERNSSQTDQPGPAIRRAGEAADGEAAKAQATHLRRLLLQRVLPEPLWGLVDGDERVLCDALLEGSQG